MVVAMIIATRFTLNMLLCVDDIHMQHGAHCRRLHPSAGCRKEAATFRRVPGRPDATSPRLHGVGSSRTLPLRRLAT